MTNVYRLEVSTQCPVNDSERDLYQVEIRSGWIIEVEKILAFFAEYHDAKIFQEDLTRLACARFGCSVNTTGVHSGVEVQSYAP